MSMKIVGFEKNGKWELYCCLECCLRAHGALAYIDGEVFGNVEEFHRRTGLPRGKLYNCLSCNEILNEKSLRLSGR